MLQTASINFWYKDIFLNKGKKSVYALLLPFGIYGLIIRKVNIQTETLPNSLKLFVCIFISLFCHHKFMSGPSAVSNQLSEEIS